MKKILLAIIFLAVCGAVSFAATGIAPPDSVQMQVSLVNQDPDPAEPGKYVDVRFKFENIGSKNARDVKVEILQSYPFSIEPGEDAVKEIGSIQGRQTGDVGAVVKYRLRVDKNAVEGANKIKLRYQFTGSDWIELPEYTINIRPIEAILSIASVSSIPEQIRQGETATLRFTLRNMDETEISDIRVKIDLTSLPFAPAGSSTEKVIDKIDAKKEAMVEFKLLTDASADSGLNKVPVAITYKDRLYKNYSISSAVGLLLGAKPDMSTYIDSATITQSGTKGEIVVKFVNKGISDIKFLNVKLAQNDEFDLMSSNEVYVGNIDSDDYETADFKLFVKKTDKKEIMLPMSIEYKDAINNDYKENVQLKLKLLSDAEAKQLGLGNGNGKIGIAIIAVIVIAGLFIYIKWRRGKRRAV